MEINVPSDPESRIFTTERGAPVRLSNFRSVFSEARDASKLPRWVTPYTLRHTAASLLAQQGVPVTTAAVCLAMTRRSISAPTSTSTRATSAQQRTRSRSRVQAMGRTWLISPRGGAGTPKGHTGNSRGRSKLSSSVSARIAI